MAASTMSDAVSYWRATSSTAATSTRAVSGSPTETTTSAEPMGFQPISAFFADRFGDPDGQLAGGVLVGGFHHHAHHLLGPGGPQQDSAGVAQLGFCFSHGRAYRRGIGD